jgi:stage IV sporulation protein B
MKQDALCVNRKNEGNGKMKITKTGRRLTASVLLSALLWLGPWANALADMPEALVPMGSTVGIELKLGGVVVVSLAPVETDGGTASPAGDAGIISGDMITAIGARQITCAEDFLTEAGRFDGSTVDVTVERNGKSVHFNVTPVQNTAGGYQLGLWLRDGVTGVGTLTYYDPASGSYGALGHGINDIETGELIPVSDGKLTSAQVVDVVKGAAGSPGELCGKADADCVLGDIEENTDKGIFGALDVDSAGECLPVASESEIALGPATMLSNISGSEVKEYSIEICRIYHSGDDNRSIMISVTDPELLQTTGGIVQGMSGSPIIQNGKLIGAVTHVLVNDPTRGYAISMEKMLSACA